MHVGAEKIAFGNKIDFLEFYIRLPQLFFNQSNKSMSLFHNIESTDIDGKFR